MVSILKAVVGENTLKGSAKNLKLGNVASRQVKVYILHCNLKKNNLNPEVNIGCKIKALI